MILRVQKKFYRVEGSNMHENLHNPNLVKFCFKNFVLKNHIFNIWKNIFNRFFLAIDEHFRYSFPKFI